METRRIGALTVGALGLGCMGMSHGYAGADEAESIRTLHCALSLGVTLLDTAEQYGPFTNEELLGRALAGRWHEVVVATKFGFNIGGRHRRDGYAPALDGRPENVRAVAEASLKRLGAPVIDLFFQHRVDPDIPIEETVGAMADLVHAGKVREIGLSEPSADTIRRAHAVHPLAAVQSEWSLWTRDPEADVLPALRELGIAFVPYSPLGRGFLTGRFTDAGQFGPDDWRTSQPRFQQQAMEANRAIADGVRRLASARGCTPAQLALAWLLNQGTDVVPIPGTTRVARLEENVGSIGIRLTSDEMQEVADALPSPEGTRYRPEFMRLLNA